MEITLKPTAYRRRTRTVSEIPFHFYNYIKNNPEYDSIYENNKDIKTAQIIVNGHHATIIFQKDNAGSGISLLTDKQYIWGQRCGNSKEITVMMKIITFYFSRCAETSSKSICIRFSTEILDRKLADYHKYFELLDWIMEEYKIFLKY